MLRCLISDNTGLQHTYLLIHKRLVKYLQPLVPKFAFEVLLAEEEAEPYRHFLRLLRPDNADELFHAELWEPHDCQVSDDAVHVGIGPGQGTPVVVECSLKCFEEGFVSDDAISCLAKECCVRLIGDAVAGDGTVQVGVEGDLCGIV